MLSFLRNKAAQLLERPAETPPVHPAVAAPQQFEQDFSPAPKCQFAGDEVMQALQMGRFAKLVHTPGNWTASPKYQAILQQARAALDEKFALVPEGFVSLALTINGDTGSAEEDVETNAFLLARHTVTNAEYQRFVDAAGYEDLNLWPETAWPQLISFKDLTGAAGPRHWRNGRHNQRLADHPVVGVCAIEAAAYAAWIGCRLPTEAEWQAAACWALRSETTASRRYPWGDVLDLEYCNIWHSGHARTLPVQACPQGAGPNGVRQLIGNVWEWTATDFAGTDNEGRKVIGDMLMRSIRGGAYDTYFPWQATSAFRSGAPCLARVHNIGFRCALDGADA